MHRVLALCTEMQTFVHGVFALCTEVQTSVHGVFALCTEVQISVHGVFALCTEVQISVHGVSALCTEVRTSVHGVLAPCTEMQIFVHGVPRHSPEPPLQNTPDRASRSTWSRIFEPWVRFKPHRSQFSRRSGLPKREDGGLQISRRTAKTPGRGKSVPKFSLGACWR